MRLSYQEGVTVVAVAQELGISPKLLYTWRSKAQQQQAVEIEVQTDMESLARMKTELERVKQERDILKKALSIFSQVK